VTAKDSTPEGGDARRVEELLRVNAELAAEIRSLSLERTDAPRSAGAPVSRRLTRLLAERDELAARLEATRTALDAMTRQRDELARHAESLHSEVTRLRSGIGGLIRRARARLFRS